MDMLEYHSAWQKMTSSRDHRYDTADPSTDHGKERVSSNRNQPALSQRSIKRKDKGHQIKI